MGYFKLGIFVKAGHRVSTFASLVKAWECPVATAVEGFGTEDTPVTSNRNAFEVPFRPTAEIRIRAERQVGELIAAQFLRRVSAKWGVFDLERALLLGDLIP